MVDVWLPYGKTEVCARISARNLLGTIEAKEKPGAADVKAEILRALNEPIDSKPLNEIVKPDHKIAIVVDDMTRPAPTSKMLPPLLEVLGQIGVKDENITIIFGCGTHRAVKPEEAVNLLGADIVNRYKHISHDCRANDLVYMGTTRTLHTRVSVNKVFADADVRILTGDIELHYYAGYGGGRKSVLPAVSSIETIQNNHAHLLHPNARTGILDGNPVHEDMIESARLARVDFILNVVTNSKNEIVKAYAGDLEKAFYEGVKLVEEMYKVPIDRRADVVIVSSGGHPMDLDLFQAYKGADSALEAVKRGGVIILVAECPEGHGNEVFYKWMQKFQTVAEMEKEIKRNFVMGGHKSYYLLRALQKVKIILVSIMPDYYAVNVFKLKTARAVNDALNEAFRTAGDNAKIWVMLHGNITLPVMTTAPEVTA